MLSSIVCCNVTTLASPTLLQVQLTVTPVCDGRTKDDPKLFPNFSKPPVPLLGGRVLGASPKNRTEPAWTQLRTVNQRSVSFWGNASFLQILIVATWMSWQKMAQSVPKELLHIFTGDLPGGRAIFGTVISWLYRVCLQPMLCVCVVCKKKNSVWGRVRAILSDEVRLRIFVWLVLFPSGSQF